MLYYYLYNYIIRRLICQEYNTTKIGLSDETTARVFSLSVDYALLGVFVKDVDSCSLKSDLDVVAGSCGGAGRNACNKILGGLRIDTVGGDIEIDLGTHKLCDINVSVDDRISHELIATGSSLRHSGRIPTMTSLSM